MFHPQTILVTGATAGFGMAITKRLIQDGHRVIATGRRTERLHTLQKELGEKCYALTLDMTQHEQLRTLPNTLPEEWRHIDVLINNAGLALGVTPAQESSIKDWETMIATNVSGLVEITHALLPGMIKRQKGYILSLGSTAGLYPYRGGNVYGATKAFVDQFMQNLRTDLLGTPIRITNIAPGLCGGSEFSTVRLGNEEKARHVYEGTTPLTPDDIAETISWLIHLPPHMNVNRMEIMPTCQASGGLAVHKEG